MERLFGFLGLIVLPLLLLGLAAISAVGFGSPWGYLPLLVALLLNLAGALYRNVVISRSRS